MNINTNVVKRIKERYPIGCRVALNFMDDKFSPPIGTKGTILFVDDIGQIHVNWDNGSSLAVNFDAGDSISKC